MSEIRVKERPRPSTNGALPADEPQRNGTVEAGASGLSPPDTPRSGAASQGEEGGRRKRVKPIRTLADLIERHDGHVSIACDTEYKGPHTLTIQFAARLGDDIVVQVYSSPAIPNQLGARRLKKLLPPAIKAHCRRVVIRPGRLITPDLSPARFLADLFGLRGVEALGSAPEDYQEQDSTLTVTLIGHHWPADFLRVFGRDFFTSLLIFQVLGDQIVIQGNKLLSFKEARGRRCDNPVLDGAVTGGDSLCAIRVSYFDTRLTFGSGSLDDLAKTFVGAPKFGGFGESEKADMLQTFRRAPLRAYAYAITDAILTLLIHEGMTAVNREMYEALGFQGDAPALCPTMGRRVSEMVVKCIARDAEGSVLLSRKGRALPSGGTGEVSPGKVKALMRKGSGDYIAEERLSEFGEQTGQTHGGLLLTRSPTQFFHQAPGMLRDVDLSGCYARVMAPMSLYIGRPVIHEPGTGGMTLREAVPFVREHAAGKDAWIIKVSGGISACPNVLIPSTKEALTNENYQKRKAKLRAARQWKATARYGLAFDWRHQDRKDTANTAIYSDVVQAGVVAHPTWLLIQALPPQLRREYEQLEVDTIIFYPAKLVAESGPAFDELIQRLRHEGTPWKAFIDMEGLRQNVEWRIDDDHVALRFDLGGLARGLLERREKALRVSGKGSAADKAWKEQVNTLYGVMASRYLATNNVVACNYITATARALAFAMQMSLNGVQVITDGCTYRRDQMPAGTFAGCLTACPDYPINRKGFGGPFLDPATIPEDDVEFTAWYQGHVKRFVGVDGPEYDELFGLHPLAHKECYKGGPASFDALCCDGSANYVKLLGDGAGWKAAGDLKDAFKARSFREKSKEALAPWLIRVYSSDCYDGPPPVTDSSKLLNYKEAGQKARVALRALEKARQGRLPELLPAQVYEASGLEQLRRLAGPWSLVYYPLGLEQGGVQVYKPIKDSAFLFRTPRQKAVWMRAMKKFTDSCSGGLEVLALRRGCKERRRGSIADVARAVYELIRAGVVNPCKALNLTRTFEELEKVKQDHHRLVLACKESARTRLIEMLDARAMDEEAKLTGLFISPEDICRFT
jgi:hypothetical protein